MAHSLTATAPKPRRSTVAPTPRGLGLSRIVAFAFAFTLAFAPNVAQADPSYLLDEMSREVPSRGAVRCPKVPLTLYGGSVVPYAGQVSVHPAFVVKLRELEAVTRSVAIEVYGRAPASMHSLGGYNCRRIPGYPNLVSEHGLGNGIDIDAFTFGPLAKGAKLPAGLPAAFGQPFGVSVARHFGAKGDIGVVHRRFLHRLALRLKDVFRVVLGPGYIGHDDHFHLDMAPYRMFDMNVSAEAAKLP